MGFRLSYCYRENDNTKLIMIKTTGRAKYGLHYHKVIISKLANKCKNKQTKISKFIPHSSAQTSILFLNIIHFSKLPLYSNIKLFLLFFLFVLI